MYKKIIFTFILLFVSTSMFAQQQAMNKSIERFYEAMRMQDIKGMGKLLKKDKMDLKGFPYLATEAGIGNLDVTKFLIENGADVNAQTADGTTPLMLAVGYRMIDTVDLLLENGANKSINAKNTRGNSALSFAYEGLVVAGLKEKSKIIVAKLLDNGADINLISRDQFITIFHSLLSNNDIDMVKLLLKNGADLSKEGSGYWLNAAAAYPRVEIIKLLMAHGLKPEHDIDSDRLLYGICQSQDRNSYEILELFISNGLDINSYTDAYQSLLLISLQRKSFEIAKLLINNNAIVNCVVGGKTPLITAIKNGAPAEIIKMILDNGADPNKLEDNSKKTALDYAKNRGDNTIINLIQERM